MNLTRAKETAIKVAKYAGSQIRRQGGVQTVPPPAHGAHESCTGCLAEGRPPLLGARPLETSGHIGLAREEGEGTRVGHTLQEATRHEQAPGLIGQVAVGRELGGMPPGRRTHPQLLFSTCSTRFLS